MNIKKTSLSIKKEKLIYKNLIKRFLIKKTCDAYILLVFVKKISIATKLGVQTSLFFN
jgi:hypothetical protein